MDTAATERIAALHRRFAEVEAAGRSPFYVQLARDVAGDATLVVFHTAVFPYVPEPARAAFVASVRASRAVWLANEAPGRIPGLDQATVDAHPAAQYLLCRDGRPLARADPHASWIHWLDQGSVAGRSR